MVMNTTQDELDELKMQVDSKQMIIDVLNKTITGKDEFIIQQKSIIDRVKLRMEYIKTNHENDIKIKNDYIKELENKRW